MAFVICGTALILATVFSTNVAVNGGYGNWTLIIPCNVTCGVGIEIWRRGCDNPKPKYGGRNCSELGHSIESRKCSREPCPIDGNYSNWTISLPCSTTCGKGVETWTRQCDNPPGKYGGNCSEQGPAQELRICTMTPCPGNEKTDAPESQCMPAEDEPTFANSDCHRLIELKNPFCQHYGFKLDKIIYDLGGARQQSWNDDIWGFQEQYKKIDIGEIIPPAECFDQARFIGCYHVFEGCDKTSSVFRPKKVCKETCLDFLRDCEVFVEKWKTLYLSSFPEYRSLFNCSEQPPRNAGDSPECMFYAKKENLESEDCLYLNGSSYHGNISVTASGIPCQSWTKQCPHRHTMNTTYPELNLAENYCRNPQNSGKRPWCFTTDRNKRWEYCDIPKCPPVNGNYGNWSLNSSCSVTCGKGFEKWRRECDNPKPKYGGRNCKHLGNTTEFRHCTEKQCPVSRGNSSWYLSKPCNVSCGQGVETWRSSCDNLAPKNGDWRKDGNCSVFREKTKYKICNRRPCPVDGNYGNWSKSACSVTCGDGYESWSRKCDNPPPKYGGNCSRYGVDKERRPCHLEPCPTTSNFEVIRRIIAVCIFIIIIGIGVILIRKRKVLVKCYKRRNSLTPYAVCEPRDRPSQSHAFTGMNGVYDRIYESIDGLNSREERFYENIYEKIDDPKLFTPDEIQFTCRKIDARKVVTILK